MKANESFLDRVVRLIIGVVLIAVAYFGVVSGVARWVAYVIGVIGLVTAATGFCLLYEVLNFRTKG